MKQHSTPQIGNAGRSRTLQALWLALANLLSLSVTLVMQAVLCRYMTTSEYGTYSQVLYVYNTLLAVFSLGLPKAYSYYLARVSPEEGRDIVRKLNGLFLLLASVFSCILLWQAAAIAGVLGNPLLAEPLRLFAAAPMLLMPVLGVENILVVYGKAHLVAVYVLISRAFMIACVVLPVVVFDAGVSGAVAGFVLASLVTCVAGLKLSSVPFRNVSPVKSRLTVRELLRFSMPVFASSMYGFVIGSASQFFVSRYLGVEDFALFANGYRELPLAGMIIGAAAGVLLPEFSRMSGEGADGGQLSGCGRRLSSSPRRSFIRCPYSAAFSLLRSSACCMGRGIGKRPVCSGSSPSSIWRVSCPTPPSCLHWGGEKPLPVRTLSPLCSSSVSTCCASWRFRPFGPLRPLPRAVRFSVCSC